MNTQEKSLTEIATTWVAELERFIMTPDETGAANLFHSESYWRDVLALTWEIQTVCGGEDVAAKLLPALKKSGVKALQTDMAVNPPRQVSRIATENIEVFFTFETDQGRGRGIVRLRQDATTGGAYKAWTFLTALEALKGFEETSDRNTSAEPSPARDFRGPNWLDKRQASQTYEDRDPTVLIVGGGQAGLSIAASLGQLNIDCLIVDKHERIGDNWRLRYHALTLHNQVQVNHLPYMPFPPTWPTYIPKDKLANWFENYVESLELNYWTHSELIGGSYDEATQTWSVDVRRSNEEGEGEIRTFHPRHVIMASGVSGIAQIPEIPTLDAFSGTVLHSSQYHDGEDWSGKKVVVIGSGNSGHDISQDLYSSGADVTMVQRSPTLVVSIEPSAQLPYTLYDEGLALEDCDLITASMPIPLVRRAHSRFTDQSRELDKDLLAGLTKIGFKLDFGEDNTGWQFKYLTRGGGYYFNVGCSDLLVEGKVGLVQYDQLDGFYANGVRLKNGDTLEADLVVLATGYHRQEVLVAKLFGDDVAAKVGPIWGFGDQIELRNMYCQTNQQGLWFMAGSLAQCRIYSKYMALQIKALEESLIGN